MKQLTKDLAENQKKLDELLGVGRNYDVISRDLYIGAWKGRLYVIDGYGDDGGIERITSFLLGRGGGPGEGGVRYAGVHRPVRHLLRGGL